MEQSILRSVKKLLGLDDDYTYFDLDIITHINSVLATCTQLGVGPSSGFMIEDIITTWDDYLGETSKQQAVKSYIFLKVRMLFDPPTTSFLLGAYKEQMAELEFRLNVNYENQNWSNPEPELTDRIYSQSVIDGGVI